MRDENTVATLESILGDVRYALGQLAQAADSGDCTRKNQDRIIRAIDALERIQCNAKDALEPVTLEMEV